MTASKPIANHPANRSLGNDAPEFELSEFFPYQVRLFYTRVTQAVSDTYAHSYDMSPPEWRTMAILGLQHELTAAQITERSSMNKVSVSRAVAKMDNRGWLSIKHNRQDGRSRLLKLSRRGKTIYRVLIPKVTRAEDALLQDLSAEEVNQLRQLMSKVGLQN